MIVEKTQGEPEASEMAQKPLVHPIEQIPTYSILDVKSAYLHGDLKETIYMQQPEGFSNGTPWVCLLIHSLYGLNSLGEPGTKRWTHT